MVRDASNDYSNYGDDSSRPHAVTCPWCGSDQHHRMFVSPDLKRQVGRFEVARCLECGLIYTRVRPKREDLARFYEDEYYDTMVKPTDPRRGSVPARSSRLLLVAVFGYPPAVTPAAPSNARVAMIRLLARLTGRDAAWVPWIQGGRLLDLGAGTGVNSAAYASLGWTPVGVEVSARASHFAVAAGLDVRTGNLQEQAFLDASFDAAILNHVLEHVDDLRSTLQELARVIRPGGWLMVRVPNALGWGARLFGSTWGTWEVPRHLVHFSAGALRGVLECSGFDIYRSCIECRPESDASCLNDELRRRFGWCPTIGVTKTAIAPFSLAASWFGAGFHISTLSRRR